MIFDNYSLDGFYDEMFDAEGRPRPGTGAVVDRFNDLPLEELRRRQQSAEKALLQMGITFSVYGDEQGTERIFPLSASTATSRVRNGSSPSTSCRASSPRMNGLTWRQA